jgi:hypothetical protein
MEQVVHRLVALFATIEDDVDKVGYGDFRKFSASHIVDGFLSQFGSAKIHTFFKTENGEWRIVKNT